MKRLAQILPVFLAAALQLMPMVRNIFLNPAAGSSFAFILRWGIGSSAALGTVDAVSGASNYFTSASNFTATVGVFFTNNLTILSSQGDGGALCTITTNGVSSALGNGQSTTFGMPPGLTLKFFDPVGPVNSLYVSISGTPTAARTNSFHVDLFYSGSPNVGGDFVIKVLAGGGTPPTISSQPASLTNNAGGNPTFSVTAAGTAPLKYQWYFNTNATLVNATNTSLPLSNVQLSDAGYYRVIITNSSGSVTSSSALLTVWQPPAISAPPAGVTNVAGGGAAFSVTASGTPTPAYQWRFATANIAGATASAINYSQLRASQSGSYTVVITNSAGAVTSSVAVLLVTNPLPRVLTSPGKNGGGFQFTFIPVVGLTNTVQANGNLNGGAWNLFSNVPPPVSANPVTVTDITGSSNRFYRVMILP